MASGQCINRTKSAVTFSSKTSKAAKERVKRELNITNEGGIGKYLGLPEHFRRKKRDIFASIVDRIRKQAQSWTSRYLSGAGKMGLLKAVLSALPTYAMSSPNSASHGWRGILAGRDILKKGLGWVVGNGCIIRVWSDNWLSTTQPLCTIGPRTSEAHNMLVSDLFLPNSTLWNVEKIKVHLPQYEAQIRKLVPSTLEMEDTLTWLYQKEGNYTTKSGYALAKVNVKGRDEGFNWSKCVWNMNCSPKLRNFLWKVQNNALAVGETLLKRGIQVDGRCKRCGESESIQHVIFYCPFAKRIWDSVPALCVPNHIAGTSIGQLLQDCTRMINLPPSGVTVPLHPWIMWLLWTSRNQLLFEDKSFSEAEVLVKAIKCAKEWQDAMEKKERKNTASPKDYTPSDLHQQNQPNAMICFSEAAWQPVSCAGGMGWLCTTQAGTTIFEGTTSQEVVGSALIAEALALKAALEAAKSQRIQELVCFSDSKSLINQLTGNTSVNELKGILHDVNVLSRSFTFISFNFVPHRCNVAADRLAKGALSDLVNSTPLG
ncbi:uncharacterized protein LOC103861146 [Brassica rapa]|uniref:uncharacterized protein LOC103861146 n=1 Tax=Brassica campestris TaxID=3711 RepID=UPI0004F1C5D6|nr:uncharacterized protein LOC103861146 [Brassica rapa]